MHGYLCVWRTSGGKYHAEGFNDRDAADRRMRELWRKPGVIDAIVTSTD